MIDYISGQVAELNPTYAVLEAAGVGYAVNISLPTYSALATAREAKLFTTEIIREDAHELYGFLSKGERELFELLMSVSGVGAATARMILSGYTASEVRQIIAVGNAKALSQVKGLGLKTAQKIIVEIKDKVLRVNLGDNPGAMSAAGDLSSLAMEASSPVYDEALQALIALGFSAAPAGKAIQKLLAASPTLTVEQVLKKAFIML